MSNEVKDVVQAEPEMKVMTSHSEPVDNQHAARDAAKDMPKREPRFYFPQANIEQMNGFLQLAGKAEVNGILDYKQAFHNLVTMIEKSLKKE